MSSCRSTNACSRGCAPADRNGDLPGETNKRPLIAVHGPDLVSLIDVFDVREIGAGAAGQRPTLTARTDVVPLDHLVQRRRLDVKALRGALLHAAGGFERRLDQPFLEV